MLQDGGPAFAGIGTEGSTGTKLFCVSGHVARPGVYEVTFGTTLGELLELAGGVPGGRDLQTVLLGGAAGGFVRADELDLPLTFEGAREAQTTLGSGVVMVFDETVDLPRALMRIAAFFRNESCGQCVPCRVGTVRQQEALARLSSGRTRGGVDSELALITEMGQCMRDASICGLGQTASSADRVGDRAARRVRGEREGDDRERAPDAAARSMPRRMVELEIDGQRRARLRGLRRSSTRATSSASTRPTSATARRSGRRTSAASASSSSRARGCSRPRARARSRPG